MTPDIRVLLAELAALDHGLFEKDVLLMRRASTARRWSEPMLDDAAAMRAWTLHH
jgi:hypothetical protein